MDNTLSALTCEPCRLGAPPLPADEVRRLLMSVPRWKNVQIDGEERIRRDYHFADFAGAFAFASEVAKLAEEQDHHPLLEVEWGRVGVMWWTHKIKGLHRNDFIMAAKTDLLAD